MYIQRPKSPESHKSESGSYGNGWVIPLSLNLS